MPEFTRTIAIQADFSTQFQLDVAMKMLNDLLGVWKEAVEKEHTKNIITITMRP